MRLASSATVLLPAVLLAASCTSAVTPAKVTAGDTCFRCGRVIADVRLAAVMVDGPLTTKFRTPGCLAKYVVDHPSETGAVFVTDYATGKLVEPGLAIFVAVIMDPNTNESDFRAYVSIGDARAAAAELHATPVGWNDVLRKERT